MASSSRVLQAKGEKLDLPIRSEVPVARDVVDVQLVCEVRTFGALIRDALFQTILLMDAPSSAAQEGMLVDWGLIVFVGLAAPTIIPIDTAEHCASAMAHLKVTMSGDDVKPLRSNMVFACIPVTGPVPESAQNARELILRYQLQSACSREMKARDECP